jgi:hypothetical protein
MTAWTIDDVGGPEVFEPREQPVPEIDAAATARSASGEGSWARLEPCKRSRPILILAPSRFSWS